MAGATSGHDCLRALVEVREMTFEMPKFSHGWARNFMRFWDYERVKLQGEAESVNWTEIKEEVEKLHEYRFRATI